MRFRPKSNGILRIVRPLVCRRESALLGPHLIRLVPLYRVPDPIHIGQASGAA
jgi:hypothetical protein